MGFMRQKPETLFDNIAEALSSKRLSLPSRPEIVLALKSHIDDPTVTYEGLKKIILKDPALTARIIQISNSALIRGKVLITNLGTAIGRLGIPFVTSVGISVALKKNYSAKHKVVKKKMQETWLHANDVSAISYVLSKYLKVGSPDEAMIAGLLHEIGVLPILSYADKMTNYFSFAEKYPDLDNDLNLLDSVIQTYNVPLSELILKSWSFPEDTVSAPRKIYELNKEEKNPNLADIILLAKIYALGNKKHPLTTMDKNDIPSYKRLGINPDLSLEALPQIQKTLETAKQIFL
jgi:HD-like signal output (HDOD) protein